MLSGGKAEQPANEFHFRGCVFLVGFSTFTMPLVTPSLSAEIADAVGGSIADIGTLVGTQGLLAGFTSLLAGPAIARYSRRIGLVALLLSYAAATISFSLSSTLPSLIASGMAAAIAFGPLTVCGLTAIGDYLPPERRGRGVGTFYAAPYAIAMGAIPLGLTLRGLDPVGWRVAYLLFAAMSVFGAGLAWYLPPRFVRQQVATGVYRHLQRYVAILRDSGRLKFVTIFYLMRVGSGMYLLLWIPYMLISREISPEQVISISIAGGVVSVGTSLVAGRLADVGDRRLVITCASITICGAMWFFVHFPTAPSSAGYVLGGATVLYLVSESFRHTTLMVDALSIVPPPSAAIFLAVISLALSLGSASGAVLGGEIMRHYQALSASRPTAIAEALSAIVYVTMGLWIIALILSLRLVSSRVRVAKATHCSADHG